MTLTRSPVRSHTRSLTRGLTELAGGISGPSISLSAPDFGGSTYYEGVDDNDITVTINNATDGASWDLTISSSGGGTDVTASGTVSGTTVNAGAQDLTGLNAGTLTFSYEEASVEVATKVRTLAATAAPDAPTNLVATHGDTQVGLSWDAPANVNGAVITDYVIEVDSGGGFSTISDGTNTNTTYTHTGLTNGTEYTYRVSAVNSVGTGSASAAASATPCSVPAQVGTVTPTAGNNQVALAWSAPGSGGSAITDYVVQYRETGSGTWLTFADGVSASTGATVTGLSNGTEYEFQVAAVNAEGQGTFSSAATATTNDVPAQVGTVTPTAGNAEVALAWSAPSANGSSITDYIVQYKLSSSGTWLTFSDGTSAGTGATVTGLTNDSAYDFRVAAVNALGTGSYSATATETPADVTLLVDHDFSSDPGYIFGGTAEITGGALSLPAANDNARFLFTSTVGNDYRIQLNVSGLNGGQLIIYMGTWSSGTAGSAHTVNSDGAVDVTLTMYNSYAGFRVLKTATGGTTIDNLTVEDA